MGRLRGFADWLDSRTGFRAGRSHLLDEPLPAGTGWWFVTGSILLFLLGVQLISGVVLTPGMVGTIPELQESGFYYVSSG